ncbi:unnamed protein product [Effrenium voratum]|nr:unnamed protein product [Effrenium voratum]
MAGHQVDLVTLQVILFVGNWFLSWGMIAYNSWCLAQGDDGHADMVNAAPVTVLVMGLFMTNLQGYFQEKYKEPKVARAAAMNMDLPLLLWQNGREICSKKPPQAWGRLKVRQALGRGIPLSMISFYLASRHVVETPRRLAKYLSQLADRSWRKELKRSCQFA